MGNRRKKPFDRRNTGVKREQVQHHRGNLFQRQEFQMKAVPSLGQHPDIREADCLSVSFSSEEVGNWNRLKKRVYLTLPKNVCI